MIETTYPYQTMPDLTAEEFAQLEDSIRANGIQVPIIVDEHGSPIDGHNRLEIARNLGLECPQLIREGLTEVEKIQLSISLNIDRRQITREQRREIIARSIASNPELTDREHARRTGVSPTTVGTVRAKLEDEGAVSKLDTRRDSRGYVQPAARPSVQKVTETQTIMHVTEIPVAAPAPLVQSEPEPPLTGEAANEQNAKQTVREIGRSLETLYGFTYPGHRDRVVTSWWDLGCADVPPAQASLFAPDKLRAIAQGLIDTAAALEAHRG